MQNENITTHLQFSYGRTVHVISECHPALWSRAPVDGCHDLSLVPTPLRVRRLDVDVVTVCSPCGVVGARTSSSARCLSALTREVKVVVHTLEQTTDTVFKVAGP